MPNIVTPRMLLREYEEGDFAAHHRLMSDVDTMFFLDDVMTHSEEESRANLADAIAQQTAQSRERLFLAATLAESGAYLGSVGYTVESFTPAGKLVHAGYFYLPQHHGKGYATEALAALLRYAFTEDGVFRFNTGCFAENKASERVMRKCGLVKEGDYPECAWLHGKMRGRLAYRLLKSEWEAMQ